MALDEAEDEADEGEAVGSQPTGKGKGVPAGALLALVAAVTAAHRTLNSLARPPSVLPSPVSADAMAFLVATPVIFPLALDRRRRWLSTWGR